VIVTDVPCNPDTGFSEVIFGATEKFTPLLAIPPTVTTTFPVVAPVGTGTPMLVSPQPVGVAEVPLKVTVLVPWCGPKFVPAIVTNVPTEPEVGFKLVMFGGGIVTVKSTPLLAAEQHTVTTTFPVEAPAGNGTVMLVSLQVVGLVAVPLKVTELIPCVAPKFVPAMVTNVPTGAAVGFRLVIFGVTRKVPPLLAKPLTVTTTLPVVAPAGTGATMVVLFQLVGVALSPLKVTVLVPWVAPKPVPVIVTEVPGGPVLGLKVATVGTTVKLPPLLAMPPTVTTTFPVVAPGGTKTTMLDALQLEKLGARVPLKVTVLVPWLAPKLVPVIVTDCVTGPEAGLRLVMLGIGGVTVIVAVPDLVGSATEVAVIVTVGGLGTPDGAT